MHTFGVDKLAIAFDPQMRLPVVGALGFIFCEFGQGYLVANLRLIGS